MSKDIGNHTSQDPLCFLAVPESTRTLDFTSAVIAFPSMTISSLPLSTLAERWCLAGLHLNSESLNCAPTLGISEWVLCEMIDVDQTCQPEFARLTLC
jgi:hypothetical protein